MYIPKNIISDNTLQYNIHLALNILQYCQVHEDYTPINIQDARTKSAICLGPSVNTQYESSHSKSFYHKDMGCNTNVRHRHIPSKWSRKRVSRTFCFDKPKRAYYWRFRYHGSGHKWKSITTTNPTTRLHRGNSIHRGNSTRSYSRCLPWH